MCAKDKVICPWCGSEMVLYDWTRIRWYGCDNCGAKAPVAIGDGDPYEIAMMRVEQKPLELSDLHDGDIVWMETKGSSILRPVQIIRTNPAYCSYYRIGSEAECGSGMGTYGLNWRCWGIAPNKYEVEAASWHDDD